MAHFYSKDDTNQLDRTSPNSASAVTSGSQPSLSKRRKFLQMAMGGAVGGTGNSGWDGVTKSEFRWLKRRSVPKWRSRN